MGNRASINFIGGAHSLAALYEPIIGTMTLNSDFLYRSFFSVICIVYKNLIFIFTSRLLLGTIEIRKLLNENQRKRKLVVYKG